MISLNQEQISRLYEEFEIGDNEEILEAEYRISDSKEICLVIRLYDGEVSWNYIPELPNTPEQHARLYYILTGTRLNSPTSTQGWDCYTHPYEYDEVKVIVLLHDAIITDKNIDADWEDIMRVGHYIWHDYCARLKDWDEHKADESCWALQNHEEAGYVQAYLARTLDYYIEKYKNCFTRR